jgi:hypothetical protein
MATRHRSSRGRRPRSRPPTSPHSEQSSEHAYGAPIPEGLHEAIQAERDNLSKAESLLACMAVALEYQEDPFNGPYFPAVAQLARELVAHSIDGLDPSVLRQRLLRNKIQEVFCLPWRDAAMCTSDPSETTQANQRLAA